MLVMIQPNYMVIRCEAKEKRLTHKKRKNQIFYLQSKKK